MDWHFPAWMLRADAWLQRRYDWLFHALMRQGVSKRQIRWHLWTLYIIAFCIYSYYVWIKSSIVAGVLFAGLTFLTYGRTMQRDDDYDRAVENCPSARSRADDPFFASIYKTLGWVLLGITLPGFLHRAVFSDAKTFWSVTHSVAMLSLGYLCGTTPVSPKPKKKMAHAELAPTANVGTYG